jgi:hypothetical protein
MKCLCNKEIIIELKPDFDSSGLWCVFCGINFANPKNQFPNIPDELLNLIEGWNWFWELAVDNDEPINKEHFKEVFRKMGIELAFQVNKFYACLFDEERKILFK